MVDTAPDHDDHSAAMVNEIDIFRTANVLVKHHGEDAPIHTAMRADAGLVGGVRLAPETRAVVSWEGPGQLIVLKVYGTEGEMVVPMVPKRALELAQELLTRGVQAIKADWPG